MASASVLLIPHIVDYALKGYTTTISVFPWGIGFLAFLLIIFLAVRRIRDRQRQGLVSWSSAWWDGLLISGYTAALLALALGVLYAASPARLSLPTQLAFVFLGVSLTGAVLSLVCAVVIQRKSQDASAKVQASR